LNKCKNPYTIYTNQNHKYHTRNLIFYKTEQKGLLFETFREISTFFAKMQKNPYTIYTNQNHKYHTENLIFYSIEQKGLFTDPGRRADSPQSTPMGSRCLLFLLSVKACGSNQGESRQNVIFSPKISEFAFRERFQVSGVEICPGVVKVDKSVLFHFQSFSSYFPVIYQTFYKNLFPVRYHVKRLEKDWTFFPSCVILEKTENTRR
jgi:hypothetical protein